MTCSLASRRVRTEDLCSSRWLRPARRCMSLPLPVTRKRFFAPLWVFILGIAASSPRWWVWRLGGAGLLGGFRLGTSGTRGLRLRASVRCHHHDHVAAVLLWCRLHDAQLLDVGGQPLQQPEPELGPRLLSTAEHDRDLDFVTGLQEPHDVTLLGLVVMRVDLGPKLHLLDDRVRLVTSRLTSLLGVLVLPLAVVHELADRRTGLGRHLDEVEIGFLSQPQRVADGDDADLLSVRTDQTHLGDTDPVVYT